MNGASGDVLGLGPGFDPVGASRVEHEPATNKINIIHSRPDATVRRIAEGDGERTSLNIHRAPCQLLPRTTFAGGPCEREINKRIANVWTMSRW